MKYTLRRAAAMFLALVLCMTGITFTSPKPAMAAGENYAELTVGSYQTAVVDGVDTREVCFRFTPTISTSYTFYSTGDQDTYGTLYDAEGNWLYENDDDGEGTNFSITYDLVASHTYLLYTHMYATDRAGSYQVTVVRTNHPGLAQDGQTLNLAAGDRVKLELVNEELASSAAWKSSNSAVASVDNKGNVTAQSAGSARITVSGVDIDGVTYSSSVTIYVMRPIALAEPENVQVTNNEYTSFLFTVPESMDYTIYSTGSLDTALEVYNSDGNYLTSNDDAEDCSNGNFSLTIFMAKGEKYRLATKVHNYTIPEGANYTVWIVPFNAPKIRDACTMRYIAVGTDLALTLDNGDRVRSIEWTSSNEKVATVDDQGVVHPLKAGQVTITVRGYDTVGIAFASAVDISVSNPKLSAKAYILNTYHKSKYEDGFYHYERDQEAIVVKGTNAFSTVKVKTGSSNLKLFDQWNDYNGKIYLYFMAKKAGTYNVTITVDGKKLTCPVHVGKVYLKYNSKQYVVNEGEKKWYEGESTLTMYPEETTTIKIAGVPEGLDVKWSSSNTKVATVSSKGKVTCKKNGTAIIKAKVGASEFTYRVEVSYKTAIKALRYAYKNYGATYSQDRRMEKGYYDCSSYVWRAYHDAGMNLKDKNWAPTAADLAKWCVQEKLMVYKGAVPASKMMPGDLIFECGADNGRYEGIYHVDLYQGNGTSLSVNRTKYFYGMYDIMVARPCGKKVKMKVLE